MLIAVVGALPPAARAVIISAGSGVGNTTAPADDPGWANVGIRGGATAIYLGNGWAITANHVGAGSTVFQGVTYNAVPNSVVQLVNPPGVSFTTLTDLILYRLDGTPALPGATIAPVVPGIGSEVVTIGRGRNRAATPTYWNSSWIETAGPSTYMGYDWEATSAQRWGTNKIDAINVLQSVQNTSERSFATVFDQVGTAYESQGAVGDSGGAVFHKNPSGQWELAGLMFAISVYSGQPANTAVFGNVTYAADLAFYREQIYSHVELPGDLNRDGAVDLFDVNIFSAYWGVPESPGDANHDGMVDMFDLNFIALHWTATISTGGGLAGGAGGLSTVPEPAAALLLAAGTACLLLHWRRRRRARASMPRVGAGMKRFRRAKLRPR